MKKVIKYIKKIVDITGVSTNQPIDKKKELEKGLSNQKLLDDLILLFKDTLEKESVGRTMLFPMYFDILMHPEDYKDRKDALAVVLPEFISAFKEVIDANRTRFPKVKNISTKWVFQFTPCRVDGELTLENGQVVKIERGKLKQLNIIVKADVQGSVEAVKQSLEKLSNAEVKVKVIHANVGGVTESDVTLAKVSNAIIIAFNVRPEALAKDMAEKEEVEIKQYSVIYHAIEDIEAAMKGMLDPEFEEKVIGNAEIRQTFKVSNVGTIAGCYVTNGKVSRNAGIRIIRDNVVIHDGKLISLKRFKDDVKEVATGYECGIQIENFNDIKEGDILEVYVMEEIKK